MRKAWEEATDLPAYAARSDIQLLKEADFNLKLRERRCKVTVQKICRVAKDEEEVRRMLKAIWENAKLPQEILDEAMEKNKELYKFERMLEERG